MQSSTISELASRTLVFVYGTLLSGESNHRYLAGAERIGEARTAAAFHLMDLGGFPALVAGGSTSVRGELYACDEDTLRRIDELEDHPDFFRRSPIALADGSRVQSYLLPAAEAEHYPRIASGDWRDAHRLC